MREARTKEIDGVRYTVNLLSPTPALDLLMDLVKMLGPGLSPVFSNLGTLEQAMDREVSDLKTEFLGEAVRALCASLDKDIAKRAIQTLAAVTVVEGSGPLNKIYEAHFAQHGLGPLFQWLPFALQVQYDDFFAVLGSAIKSAPRPAVMARA